MAQKTSSDTLLEFPCEYPLKAFGNNTAGFATHLRELLTPIIGTIDNDQVERLRRNVGVVDDIHR